MYRNYSLKHLSLVTVVKKSLEKSSPLGTHWMEPNPMFDYLKIIHRSNIRVLNYEFAINGWDDEGWERVPLGNLINAWEKMFCESFEDSFGSILYCTRIMCYLPTLVPFCSCWVDFENQSVLSSWLPNKYGEGIPILTDSLHFLKGHAQHCLNVE